MSSRCRRNARFDVHGYNGYACDGDVYYACDRGRYVRVYFD